MPVKVLTKIEVQWCVCVCVRARGIEIEQFDAVTAANYCCSIFHTVFLISCPVEQDKDFLFLSIFFPLSLACTHTHTRSGVRRQNKKLCCNYQISAEDDLSFCSTSGLHVYVYGLCLCQYLCLTHTHMLRCNIVEGKSIQYLKALWVIHLHRPSGCHSVLFCVLLPEYWPLRRSTVGPAAFISVHSEITRHLCIATVSNHP